MVTATALVAVVRAIGRGDREAAGALLDAQPELVTARIGRADEMFVDECRAQVYAGDTALHAAAFAYDVPVAQRLIAAGADVRARNRRGAEPLHAAITGGPGSTHWDPALQRDMIRSLVAAGAAVDARAAGGVTPLHRAVRNRCSAAVDALLDLGADPHAANDSGSTALTLARVTSGRPGTGSPEARAEQERIVAMLDRAAR